MLIPSPSTMARSDPGGRRSSISGRFISAARTSRHPRTSERETSGPSTQPAVSRFLIDNSVWTRLATNPVVADAFRALVNAANPTEIHICPPIAAEYGYSSRTGADHTNLSARLAAFTDCPIAPTTAEVLNIQNALWNGGLLRAVGAMDTLITAYGIVNQATVVHYDSDFEHIRTVLPAFAHRWIVPRGTL